MAALVKLSTHRVAPGIALGTTGRGCGIVTSQRLRAGYATTAKPAMNTKASDLSTSLWKNFNVNLRHAYLGAGGKFDSKTQVFYTAPMGSMGIPAGSNITAPYTNFGVYSVADTLLDVKNPVFTPGTGSYIQRQARYLDAIQLPRNTMTGASIRLGDAQKKQADVQATFDALNTKARAAFDADTGKPANMPFATWVSKNYPQWDTIRGELQAAASATESAEIEVYGPGAKELNRRRSMLDKAQDLDVAHQGLNMAVVTDQANVLGGAAPDPNALLEYRPLYTISSGYTDAVKQWVNNSASDSATGKQTMIDLSNSKYSNETWEQSGYSNTSVNISGAYDFISASVGASTSSSESHSAEETLWSGAKVTLKSAPIKAFDVKAGSWDGDFANLYSGKNISMMADFTEPEACAVSTIIMGYNVSYEVSLGSKAAQHMADLYSKASSEGASISFLGIPIGIGGSHSEGSTTQYGLQKSGSDFSHFSIAPEDNGYPVVLGVVGRKLKEVKARSH